MIRHNNFDALRLTAASMVLVSHMAPLSGRTEWMWMGEHSLGNLGVLIFFSISGYLVTASWASDPDLGRFLARRYLRLFPGLAVAFVVTWAIVQALGLQGFPNNPRDVMNGSLWTIEFEVYCYLILAAVSVLLPRAPLVFALGMVSAYALGPRSYLSYFGLFFAAGALAHAYPVLRSGRAVALLVAAGAAVLLATGNTIIALALALPAVTLWAGLRSWPVLRSAGRQGDLSYGIYVYAWPVQQCVVALLPEAPIGALLAVSFAVTGILAWLSWHYVEAPMLKRKPSERASPGVHVGLQAGEVRAGRGSAPNDHAVKSAFPPA